MIMDKEMRIRMLNAKQRICEKFEFSNWMDVGLITGQADLINNHPRLLRSLGFNDPDYDGCVVSVLEQIVKLDKENLSLIERYLNDTFKVSDISEGVVSAVPCSPHVFKIPSEPQDANLVAVMMPFDAAFNSVYSAIGEAVRSKGMKCARVDDIWEDSTIIQDVFTLIYRSSIVVCDFSGKNPNVFYEAGIAHTLGRPVIPLAQHESDVPFDLKTHRYIKYLANEQGLTAMSEKLAERIATLTRNMNGGL